MGLALFSSFQNLAHVAPSPEIFEVAQSHSCTLIDQTGNEMKF